MQFPLRNLAYPLYTTNGEAMVGSVRYHTLHVYYRLGPVGGPALTGLGIFLRSVPRPVANNSILLFRVERHSNQFVGVLSHV